MLKVDFNNMTSDAIGDLHGIDIINSVAKDGVLLQNAFDTVHNSKGSDWQEWMKMPHASKDSIDEILGYANSIRQHAHDLVVFGIGGSALGVQSVATALTHLRYNSLPYSVRQAPRLHIEDNIDPNRFGSMLDIIDLDKTHFIVTTKSGNTSETLAQFLCIYDLLIGKLGRAKAVNAITVITTFGKGDLYEVAKSQGFRMYDVPKGVGGRFSVLSTVGLVALAAVGIDIVGLLQGAKDMQDRCFVNDVYANPALMTAYLQVLNIRKGKNIGVLMPYADNLKYIADFYAQLWAESLGKAVDKDGKTVNVGQTPVKSLGVTDQHSMVQLFNEGPHDKVITFVTIEEFGNTVNIPKVEGVNMGEFLSGHTLNELLNAERIATEYAITNTNKPNYNIILGKCDAYTVGELLAYLMMQTAFAGAMLNIDTYNQPGVEQGKVATFAMLGRKGYEETRQAIQSVHKDPRLII
ncbi:MAG: glucose-6-phosphate isomerase [Clostridiales bacterium]|jgi:glucose-6-phosphate isomerase|nr:glucose-6-phosphate isomerase [Clostridiales bacterium]